MRFAEISGIMPEHLAVDMMTGASYLTMRVWVYCKKTVARHWETAALLLAATVFLYQATGFFLPEQIWNQQVTPISQPGGSDVSKGDIAKLAQAMSRLSQQQAGTLGLADIGANAMDAALLTTKEAKAAGRHPKKKARPLLQPSSIGVNQASAGQLDLLPGIGPKLAQRIVAYRKQNGPFQRLEDLKNVKGIGEKNFSKMQPYLALR
ncbi:MAG: ComEA family DNA-binding protein [Vampirovibrionales bacterium]|nr:ComEA family DNA-binding protein [Vampirovibrionales bacterium]